MNRWFAALGLIACLQGTVRPAAAADEARQILLDTELRNRTLSQEYTGEIVVISSVGKERRKSWRSFREGYAGTANRLIRFLSPPEVRGVGFLSRSRAGKSPDQWMYLPSMKRERRIAPQDRDTPFVGTDFNYEDLEEFDQAKFEATRLADQNLDGIAAYAIQVVARERSVYERKVLIIRKDTLWVLRMDGYRPGDKGPSKRLTFSDFAEVDGHWMARRMEMADERKGSRTVVQLTSVALDRPQPADRFTLQNLLREGGDDVAAPVSASKRPVTSRPTRTSVPERSALAAQASSSPAVTLPGLSGYVEASAIGFMGTATDRDPLGSLWGTVFIEEAARLGVVRMTASLRAQQISSATEVGPLAFDLADRASRRSPLSIRELSVTMPIASAIDVEVGRFVVAWGVTDVFSPADAIVPRDATDPLASEVLPLWGARVRGERGRYRFDLYTAFVTTPWRLPSMDGRYSPFSLAEVYFPEPTVSPPTEGFEMVRVQRLGDSWDVGVWARTGIRSMPILEPRRDEETKNERGQLFVPLDGRFTHEEALGLQFAHELDQWILRGEGAYLHPDDGTLGDAMFWSAEAEHRFRSGSVVVTAAGNALGVPTDPLLLSDRSLQAGFVLAITQDDPWGRWHVGWLGTYRKIGGVLQVEASRALSDVVRVTLTSDLPYGARLDSPGALARARRLRLALRWSW